MLTTVVFKNPRWWRKEEKYQTKFGSDKINYMQKNNGFINKSRTNH